MGGGRGGGSSRGGGFSGAADSITARLMREKALKEEGRGGALYRDLWKGDIKKRQPWRPKETQSVRDSSLGFFFINVIFLYILMFPLSM
jgi:hypothetical protein